MGGTLAIWRSSHKKPLTHSLLNWILVIPLQKSIGRLVSTVESTVPWEKTSLRRHAWTCMVSGVLTPSTLPRMELARLIGLRGKKRTRSGSPIVMSKTHLLITPSRSQMSIGNAMGRRSPNMGSEHSFVALFWDNVAQMRRHVRHPRIFSISQDALENANLLEHGTCTSVLQDLVAISILLIFDKASQITQTEDEFRVLSSALPNRARIAGAKAAKHSSSEFTMSTNVRWHTYKVPNYPRSPAGPGRIDSGWLPTNFAHMYCRSTVARHW